jgi:uncharacterized protein (DUF58 family)
MTSEFTEYRLFRQGDDPRRLDWKLLARTDRAYLRITDDHAIRATSLVLDASASMNFPEDGATKWLQAKRLAVGLAAVARAEGDPVGLTVCRESWPLVIPPRSLWGVIGEIARGLDSLEPVGRGAVAGAIESSRRGWRVAIISDFLGDEAALLSRTARLIVEGVEVFAIHIVADEEIAPLAADRLAVDPENAELRRVWHQEVRGPYQAAFESWRTELAARWRLAGAEFTEVRAAEDTASAIRRIVREG